MGEEEIRFGEQLAGALWSPKVSTRRSSTNIYFIGKSVCATEAAEGVARRMHGKKIDKRMSEAADALLKDIGAALDSGKLNDELAEGATALARDLEKVAVPLPVTGTEMGESLSVDVLVGIAHAALSASPSDRHGCFGPLPKRRGCF